MISVKDLYRIRKWIKKLEKGRHKSKNLNLHYPVIGCGKNRRVYDLGNGYVLKVAISKKGISDCANEQKLSSQSPNEVKCYFANVLIGGRGWVIMKKYERRIRCNTDYRNKIFKIREHFYKQGILPIDLFTITMRIHSSNIRLDSNGKLIVIDYGSFKRKKRKV